MTQPNEYRVELGNQALTASQERRTLKLGPALYQDLRKITAN